jgi:hypothetical protein
MYLTHIVHGIPVVQLLRVKTARAVISLDILPKSEKVIVFTIAPTLSSSNR